MRSAFLFVSALLFALPAFAGNDDRRDFQAARAALERGRLEEFARLTESLREYPLYPYLRFDQLRLHFAQTPDDEVEAFIEKYADSPLAGRLRSLWLSHLGTVGRFDKFLALYGEGKGENSTELRCHYLNARLRQRAEDGLWQEAEQLWLAGKPQPDACDAVFEAWRDAGHLTREKVILRLERAMDRKEVNLARWLATQLPKEEQAWMDRMLKVSANPEKELEKLSPVKGSAMNAAVFAYGVRRLARSDLEKADALWERERRHYSLSVAQKAATERILALNRAYRRDAGAQSRLATLGRQNPEAVDKEARQWRVRAGLWQQDWPSVLEAIEALPEEERNDTAWRYWRARALQASGRPEEAGRFYREAAECRCYYGFLASEQLGEPPNLASEQVKVGKQELSQVSALPAMVRLRELEAVEMVGDARREWRHAALNAKGAELRALARLGYERGWHDLVLHTLAKTEAVNDLELRFPTPYREEIAAEARQRALDDAFVYAVMRQESAFNAAARSPVGAMGLMQLMPATAKATARQIKYALKDIREVLDVRNNIRLGTAHLKHLLDRYDGNRVYTMAAYNAGPGRVTRWLPSSGRVPADVWISGITFDETREYVKRILAYTLIYEWRLGRKPTPISRQLPIVEAAGSALEVEEPEEPRESAAVAADEKS